MSIVPGPKVIFCAGERKTMGRPRLDLNVTAEERHDLESIASSRSFPHGLVRRAQMILWSDDGFTVSEIARRTKATPAAVSNWRRRFRDGRVPGSGLCAGWRMKPKWRTARRSAI